MSNIRSQAVRVFGVTFAVGMLALTSSSTMAEDDIDWDEALRAYYTADVVYERCGFHATWEQLNALRDSIDDAEGKASLSSAEQVSLREAVEEEARGDESDFCEENGRRLLSPDYPD